MVTVDDTSNLQANSDVVNPNENDQETAKANNELSFLAGTFATTTVVFAIFFVQGILLARVLGPVGRGEFGSIVLFAQQLLLYVGLLGGAELLNRYAKKPLVDVISLKYSAVSLSLVTGVLTALTAIVLSAVVFGIFETDKAYLIPYCFLAALFVPFEHMHLMVSGVDRGTDSYGRYNLNRLLFTVVFPILLLVIYLAGASQANPFLLFIVCSLFVLARICGLLPTLRGLTFSRWLRFRKDAKTSTAPSTKKLLREGVPYAWSMFATELFERLDLLLIVLLAPVKQAGFYFVAVPAAALLTIGPNALSVFTFNAGASNRLISMRKMLLVIGCFAVFQIVSVAILWFVVPKLIVLFYGSDFEPATRFVKFLLPACAIKGFLQPLDGYLKGCGKPFVGVWSRAASILAMLIFAFFAFEQMGLYSIPLAACLGQALSMVIITSLVIHEVWMRNEMNKGQQCSP